MDAFQIIVLSMLVLLIAFHLVCCFLEKENLRKITKIFLLPFVAVFLLALKCDVIFIYLGLLFGAIGDVILIKNKDEKYFLCGLVSFLIGHIFYIYLLVDALSYTIPIYVYIIVTVALVVFVLFSRKMILDMIKKKLLIIPMAIYSFALAIIFVLSFSLMIDNNVIGSVIVFIGSLFFIASDFILTFTTFIKDFPRRDFYIMITYLLAEIGISVGLFLVIG